MWLEPICDRTEEDVRLGRPKGCCNAEDLTRLEVNSGEVGALLGLPLHEAAAPWGRDSMPTAGELGRILGNIEAIRAAYTPYASTPPAPAAPLNLWNKWNDLEQILRDSRRNILDNNASRSYTGELLGGEGIGVI